MFAQTQIVSSLRDIINNAAKTTGMPLSDLTVLGEQRDPYRADTPKGHALGKWMADAYGEVQHSIEGRRIHLRGLFYVLLGRVTKPDGTPFVNTIENWKWLSETVAPLARWLGYLDWDLIKDGRNEAPTVYTNNVAPMGWELRAGEVELLLPDALEPRLAITGDIGVQPWRHVIIAEKQGVEDLMLPLAKRYRATLVLPKGEVSATLLYDVLKAAHEDGRGVAFFQMGDCDPAGHQMAVSTARKVQAQRDLKFPDLPIVVEAPALTPAQATDWALPDTPLKATERRAERWLAYAGREQCELDAAVALSPDNLVKVMRASIKRYWDTSLEERAREARARLEAEANEQLTQQLGPDLMERIRQAGEARLAELEEQVDAINDALTVDTDLVDLPALPDPVEARLPDGRTEPLYSSEWDWATASRKLKTRKAY